MKSTVSGVLEDLSLKFLKATREPTGQRQENFNFGPATIDFSCVAYFDPTKYTLRSKLTIFSLACCRPNFLKVLLSSKLYITAF